jgi:hypothetical protein
MRAWSSGADTGIVITSLGVESGIGASTALAATRATRFTRVARFGLAGAAAAGDS